jgi:hypothetical protein
MTLLKPGIGYVHYEIERIRQSVAALEAEMLGHYASGPKAEEMKELAERLVNLTKPSKGRLPEGMKAREVKDAA